MAINIYNHTNLFPILGTGKPILLIQWGYPINHRIWPPYGGGATSMYAGVPTNLFLGAYYTTNDVNNIVNDVNNRWMAHYDIGCAKNMNYYYGIHYGKIVGAMYYKAYVKYTASTSVTFNVTMLNAMSRYDQYYVSQSTGVAGTNIKKIWTGYVTNASWGNTLSGTKDYILPPAPTTTGVTIHESAVVLSYTDMS